MKLAITTEYSIATDTTFDMPDGKMWDDVDTWYVKWGTLFLFFKDDTAFEIETSDIDFSDIDTKRPDKATIRPCDADEWADYSVPALAEDAA